MIITEFILHFVGDYFQQRIDTHLVSIYGNKTNKNKKHVTQCTSMACVCAFNLSNIRLWPNTASLLFWCIMPNSIIQYEIVYIIITTIYNSV